MQCRFQQLWWGEWYHINNMRWARRCHRYSSRAEVDLSSMSNDDRQNEDVENSAKFEQWFGSGCVYLYIHAYIYTYVTCMYVYMYVYINMYIYVCIHTCAIYMDTYRYVYIYMCIRTYICIYTSEAPTCWEPFDLILLDSRVVILKSSGIWPLCPAIRDLLGVIEETLASQGVGDLRWRNPARFEKWRSYKVGPYQL